MSSSLGGDSHASKSLTPNKIKSSLISKSYFGFRLHPRHLKKKYTTQVSQIPIPTSSGLQQIINNTLILNTSHSAFDYINSAFADNNSSADLVINNSLFTDNFNDPTSSSIPDVNSILITTSTYSIDISNDTNMSSQRTQLTFSSDYNSPVIIFVKCIDINKNLGNRHPIKEAKFFSTNFIGTTNIKPASFKKINISFDSILNDNLCLIFDALFKHGSTVSIPSNLIYSFGIIKLDSDISEDVFQDGGQSFFSIVSFKRIHVSVKKRWEHRTYTHRRTQVPVLQITSTHFDL